MRINQEQDVLMGVVKKLNTNGLYKKFDQIDGSHPLKKVLPEGYVDYAARLRKGGKVAYFNFDLAKEMGLIPQSEEEKLTKDLKAKILETFSIQIINEYDIEHNRTFPASEMKDGTYMATRYLQLQHDSKTGKTSGDGRSVWNGQVKHNKKTWDISSCGTGGTCLSPATSKYNKFFETGDPSISYGCGYAELDEGLATALMSKIFHENHHSTEQTLAIIEFDNNISINVRAHENLIRPSHVFLYLRQDDLASLTAIVDYYIERQREKEDWHDCPQNKKKYDYLLHRFATDFAKLSADLEDEYIFCWLDWDGDNILMDGGIIDYGSIRQFGLFHYEYRYDDVERFSTNLLEQRTKAKHMVQSMTQAMDYIKNGVKTTLADYATHDILNEFDTEYEARKNYNILYRVGLTPRRATQLLKRNKDLVLEFRKVFSYFEQTKSSRGKVEISDGVTWDAVFSMRDLLREYPQVYSHLERKLEDEEFLNLIKSELASEEDLVISSYRKQKISEFQKLYLEIVEKTAKLFQESVDDTWLSIIQRSCIINKPERITGDAITYIVDLIIQNKEKLNQEKLHQLVNSLAASQNLNPDKKVNFPEKYPKGLLKQALEIIKENREGI